MPIVVPFTTLTTNPHDIMVKLNYIALVIYQQSMFTNLFLKIFWLRWIFKSYRCIPINFTTPKALMKKIVKPKHILCTYIIFQMLSCSL